MTFPLHVIPLMPFIGAAINLLLGRRLSRGLSSGLAVVFVAASFMATLVAFLKIYSPDAALPNTLHEAWYTFLNTGGFRLDIAFLLDPLSGIMTLVVTGVGLLIHIYSVGYMSDEKDYARYFGYLNLFMGSMLLLVLGENLLVSFIGWEGVGACSYLLIGFWYQKDAYAYAGRKAFITNRVGDFGFLLGMFLVLSLTGTLSYRGIEQSGHLLANPLWLGLNGAFWVGILIFIGATGKSAQLPLYVWLPDAMAGPTPVSALIHAATMVTAGVYMVVRLRVLPSMAPYMLGAVMVVGVATALFAATMAFCQRDLKKVLAYSTISQLGFMFVGAAGAIPSSGIFHVVTHAFFKAGLFLGAGSVMHAVAGETDIFKMGGLRKKLPITHLTFLVYTLAIAGCPPLAGFFSKDGLLESAIALDHLLPGWHGFGTIIAGILVLTAGMTSFYMFRLYYLTFSGEPRDHHLHDHAHESPPVMTVPLVILAILSAFAGLLGTPWKNYFGEFLGAPPELHIPWINMAFSFIAFFLGWLFAHMLYKDGVSPVVERFTKSISGLYKLVWNKYYVDELYDFIIIRPLRALAKVCSEFFDRILIDRVIVGGLAKIPLALGFLVRQVQSGDPQRYVAWMVVGAAALLWYVARPSPTFRVETKPGGKVLVTATGADDAGRSLEFCWRIDGGPGCLSKFGNDILSLPPGKHKLTLAVEDNAWRAKATHTEEVEALP